MGLGNEMILFSLRNTSKKQVRKVVPGNEMILFS